MTDSIVDAATLAVPVTFRGKRDPGVVFTAVAVGLSETGLGFRSSDQRLGLSSLEGLIRQPFRCEFEAVNMDLGEILVRILRIEACRRDPAYLYFGALEFLQISDLDQLMLQTGLTMFARMKDGHPVIGPPPPPPARRPGSPATGGGEDGSSPR